MSRNFPIVSITGASGAGTTTVHKVIVDICQSLGVRAAFVEGDSFHRYDRSEMAALIKEWERTAGRTISHFGPEANLLSELEALFQRFGKSGSGRIRHYIHNEGEASIHGGQPGTFTGWKDIEAGTKMLVYEGLHGGAKVDDIDIAHHVDLLIGVTPIVNLEWIQKLHRDQNERGRSVEDVTDTILRRMPDYIKYIVPQFSQTDINFQRIPLVDTSNPFAERDIPDPEESLVIIRFRIPDAFEMRQLLDSFEFSRISRSDSLVIRGEDLPSAMRTILSPRIEKLLRDSES